ncbi:T9SS type A sorting domain-containing protein [Adhaeribacter sp. BT258]|uniref:T9SS type A sorting domain-containing protein n=1 Tax=Adhaeribacter terrigena TaxID=2793070 RepID=A0ABS1C5W0_9BACT|nr:T9SS type A sorting domain-containing protein [Adhaeribacter terrigena]MBK0404601.1 T9SS type A sorting domain-containing protein [Adhaeribacter terrigena]
MLTMNMAEAQTDYIYRSINSGAWNNTNTWARAHKNTPTVFTALAPGGTIPNRNAENIEISDGHTVTYDYTNNVDQIIIKPGGVLELPSGQNMNVYVAPSTDRIVVQGVDGKQGIFRNYGGTITYKNPSNVTVSSNFEVNAYGKYEHVYNATLGTVPLATWDANSEIEFKMTGVFSGLTLADYQTRGFAQNFGNVKWNTTGNTSNVDLRGVITNVQGNFEVLSTGTGTAGSSGSALILSSNATYNLSIGKNLIVSGGNADLVFASSGTPSGGVFNLTIGEGMQVKNGGAFRNNKIATPLNLHFTGTGLLQNTSTNHLYSAKYIIGANANISLGSDITVPEAQSGGVTSTFDVNGALNANAYSFLGNGDFSLNSSATLSIGHASGITTGSTGTVKVGGTRTFSPSANYIYNGTVAQFTGNALPASISKLKVNNVAGLRLSAPVLVTGTLEMAEGIITATTANKLTMASNATVVMPSLDKVSYVSGPMAHTVDINNFDDLIVLNFPIGKNGKYRPIELSVFQLDPISTTYTAEQFEQAYTYPANDSLPSSIANISKIRYFKIDKSTNADVTAQIKLMYASDDMVTDYQKLTIAKYNSVNKWADILATASSDGTITSDFFDNFSDFVLANKKGGTNPLPVELLSFKVAAKENATALTWETASEKNSSHFEIERSHDARTFETIGTEKAMGNSQTFKRYAFADQNPMSGVAYYRLKQVDLDGTIAYSKIEQVNRNAKAQDIQLYPNPTAGRLYLQTSAEISNVRMLNVLGQEVYSAKENIRTGFDIAHLPNGVYQVIIDSNNKTINLKFLKAGF